MVLDFVGNSGKHKLIRCEDVLGGRYDDEVVQEVAKQTAKGDRQQLDIVSELVKAEREIAKRRKEAEEAARRSKITLGARYRLGDYVDPFNALDITPCRVPGYFQKKPATDRQRKYIESQGLNVPDDLNFVHASQIIEKVMSRPSDKQLKHLVRHGFPTDVNRKQASVFMDAIIKNNWMPLPKAVKLDLIAKVVGQDVVRKTG